MDIHKKTFTTKFGEETIEIEVSDLAGQANASLLARHGDTTVLATTVMSKEDKPGDFFPLTVDFEERFYAAGKILGSRFMRREGRPSDEAILSGRLIDRTIRPLFDARLRREVQVVITVLSYDEKYDPDMIGLFAASTVLAISDIPWGGPVAGVQHIERDEKGVQISKSFFAGLENSINMIEFEAKNASVNDAQKAYERAAKEIQELITFQKSIVAKIGKPKADVPLITPTPEFTKIVENFLSGKISDALKNKKINDLKKELFVAVSGENAPADSEKQAEYLFEKIVDAHVHEMALSKNERADGRKLDEVRELQGGIDILKLPHGSGLFIRGATQVLSITTLGSMSAEQLVETIEGVQHKRFMLHYNFPKYATGEVSRSSRGPGRREIGHGALAAKAVSSVLPDYKTFPYVIRVVAETLSSNGSSSMATTCATSLSLMSAGVPIRKHVAGIAIGLMLDEAGKEYKILTDIQGPEDHYGDMDFKVAGTRDGIVAIQMDVKINGITKEIYTAAIDAARKAHTQILDVMEKAIPESRPEVSVYAPKIMIVMVPKEKIGEVIGSGGKIIQGLIAAENEEVSIDIEEDGTTYVAGIDRERVTRTAHAIEQIIREFEIGEVISGPIVKIFEFGAIVDLGGGKDGMIHVSELADGFVKRVEDVVKLGDVVTAKVVKVDRENGKIGLSLKALAPKKEI
jgi:polyribonucleotide nucleotidyltransferase